MSSEAHMEWKYLYSIMSPQNRSSLEEAPFQSMASWCTGVMGSTQSRQYELLGTTTALGSTLYFYRARRSKSKDPIYRQEVVETA